MKQETKRRIEISNLHEFADSLILIDNRIERCKKHQLTGKTHYTFSFIFYTFILHEYRLFILLIRYLSFIYNII